jgi:hypothetical protein
MGAMSVTSGSGPRSLLLQWATKWKSSLIYRATVATWMNVLIALTAFGTLILAEVLPASAFPPREDWAIGALKLFALWCFAFVPGWLYVRFLGLRAGVLWAEYVLSLHRLGWDARDQLPAPPPGSSAVHDPGPVAESRRNIYRQKFDAYYGRRVSDSATKDADDEDFTVSVETLFPVFLCTAVLSVGWAAVLWDPSFVVSADGPWDALKFGFLGAYAFGITMLIRRFFQSDLRPSAYAGVVLRIILVLLIVVVLHQLFAIGSTGPSLSSTEMVTAFFIGFFPLVGLQAIQRVSSKALHVVVPQLSPDYPLDQLDGLNVWYEARLTEEGVEDMQNLTTMNLVDVILHTRVPVGRLVDWVDQAFLLIHLEPVDRKLLSEHRKTGTCEDDWHQRSGVATRIALRRVGIRTATDLLKAMPDTDNLSTAIANSGLDVDQLRLLVTVLKQEEGLVPIQNWEANGVKPCVKS